MKTSQSSPATTLPLWLDLKKEYLDDNFDRLLPYLQKNRVNPNDPFFLKTIELLNDRVDDVIADIAHFKIYQDEESEDRLIFNIRLLSCALLMESAPERELEIWFAMMLQLKLLVPKFDEKIMETAMERLRYDSISAYGFHFSDLFFFKPEIFAHNVCNNVVFGELRKDELVYENNGRAWLKYDGLTLTATGELLNVEREMKFTSSIDTGFSCRLGTRNAGKLKRSESDNLLAMDEFIDDFVQEQRKPLKRPVPRKTMPLEKGDETVVKIIWKDENEIQVVTMDPIYGKLRGKIVFSNLRISTFNTNEIHKNLRSGYRLPVTVVDPSARTFSFERQFLQFIVDDARHQYGDDGEFIGKLIGINQKNYFWIDCRGNGFCSYNTGNYAVGDYARLHIKSYEYGPLFGKINVKILEHIEEPEVLISERQVRDDCLEEFCARTYDFESENETEGSENPLKPLSESILRMISRFFYSHQRTLLRPSDRYRLLCNARVISELVDDKSSASFLKFTATYLRAVVRFATNESLDDIKLQPGLEYQDSNAVKLRLRVIDLLKEYGRRDISEVLNSAIVEYSETQPLLSTLARLIQAANSIQDTLSSTAVNIIRREIIRTLSLETEDDVDLEGDTRPYIGAEGQTVEFKTSIVYPPDNNMQPNPQEQIRNVFKGICAFLNSPLGGTLYLGVNDSGHVVGLQNDFDYLKCQTFDTFARYYIQDKMIEKFGVDVMSYIHIDPAFDEQVVVVRVDPYPYRVIELDDVAYMRVERETRVMPDSVKRDLAAKKIFHQEDYAAAVIQLQHASFKRRKAILHSYSDTETGRIMDRLVEPYDVMPEHGLLQCYDYATYTPRVLSIARIGYVEVLDDRWTYTQRHREFEIDAFRQTGQKPISVSLELDLHAKSLMTDEYPATRKDIVPCKGQDNVWYYNGEVRDISGLGRFYIGLADHIKILDAPELLQYVADYIQKFQTAQE